MGRQSTDNTPIASRENAIGFLRFVLASLVIYYHCYPLGGYAPPSGWARLPYWTSDLAVPGFFFLSGLLITKSFDTSRSWKRFMWNRVLRIFPGYWVCLVVTAFGFGSIAALHEHGSTSALFAGGDGPFTYIARNSLLLQKQAGVSHLFATNPFPFAVNGSLWTLINEFLCYIGVCALGVMGMLRRRRLILLAAALLLVWFLVPAHVGREHLPHKAAEFLYTYFFLQQALFFALGAVCWLFRERIYFRPAIFALSVAGVVAAFALSGWMERLLLPICFSYALLWLGFNLPSLNRFDGKADYSYGIYIYAFPVQQTLAMFGLAAIGVPAFFVLALACTWPLAWLSWNLVEKRALALKKDGWTELKARFTLRGRSHTIPEEAAW